MQLTGNVMHRQQLVARRSDVLQDARTALHDTEPHAILEEYQRTLTILQRQDIMNFVCLVLVKSIKHLIAHLCRHSLRISVAGRIMPCLN